MSACGLAANIKKLIQKVKKKKDTIEGEDEGITRSGFSKVVLQHASKWMVLTLIFSSDQWEPEQEWDGSYTCIDSVDYMDTGTEAGREDEIQNGEQELVFGDSVGVIANRTSVPSYESCTAGKGEAPFSLGLVDKPSRKKSPISEKSSVFGRTSLVPGHGELKKVCNYTLDAEI